MPRKVSFSILAVMFAVNLGVGIAIILFAAIILSIMSRLNSLSEQLKQMTLLLQNDFKSQNKGEKKVKNDNKSNDEPKKAP